MSDLIYGTGFHRALVTIDSAIGLLTLETGTSRVIGIGEHPYQSGPVMMCKKQVVDCANGPI